MTLFTGSLSQAAVKDAHIIAPKDLDRSIDNVLQHREFSWRMPREKPAEDQAEPKGPIASAVAWVIDWLGKGFNAVVKWINDLIDWLLALLPTGERRQASPDTNWVSSVRIAAVALLIGLLAVLAYILWRSWSRRQSIKTEIVATAIEPAPDLEDEDTTADDLPVNRWLDLARELARKGSLRLAMRIWPHPHDTGGFFLAVLEKWMRPLRYEPDFRESLKRVYHYRKQVLAIFDELVDSEKNKARLQ